MHVDKQSESFVIRVCPEDDDDEKFDLKMKRRRKASVTPRMRSLTLRGY